MCVYCFIWTIHRASSIKTLLMMAGSSSAKCCQSKHGLILLNFVAVLRCLFSGLNAETKKVAKKGVDSFGKLTHAYTPLPQIAGSFNIHKFILISDLKYFEI